MERTIEQENGLAINMVYLAIVTSIAFSMIVIVFGVEPVLQGAHDMFHDFRHVIGMPCH